MMNFGEAIEALKRNELVAREGWNGKGMFLFMRPTAEVQVSIVKSLPDSVKEYYLNEYGGDYEATFTNYICMKTADDTIVNGWLASQTDMLAEDWIIIN